MKESFTRSMSFLHTWGGLIFGWLLFSIFFTGALSVFYEEITTWATPQLHAVAPADRNARIEQGAALLSTIAPESRLWRIVPPDPRDRALELQWRNAAGKTETRRVNPETGEEVTDTLGGRMFIRYHYRLNLDRDKQPIGFWIVGIAGIAMIVACISGIVIHKRIFRDFFVFRPRASRQRGWTDAHNVLSVLPLPFHILIALSGILVYYWMYMPAGVASLYGGSAERFREQATYAQYRNLDEAAAARRANVPIGPLIARAERIMGSGEIASVYVRDPGTGSARYEFWGRRDGRITQQVDRAVYDGTNGRLLLSVTDRPPIITAQSFVVGLHFALFGGAAMRWLYFFCGLAGAATIAAGLILFVVKRQKRDNGLIRWVARINVAAIMGPVIASTAYMWAIRLLPASLTNRTGWEASMFFASFAGAAVFALAAPPRTAWPWLLGIAGLPAMLLPLTGMIFPRGFLPIALARGDGALAGVDLVALVGGLGLLLLAGQTMRRMVRTVPGGSPPA